MYMSFQSASTSVRMTYANQQNERAGTAPAAEKSEKTGDSGSFADILAIASKDMSPISNIEAYVQDSVNKVLEKIADHASKTFSEQSGEYSVSFTSVSITIEMDEGENLQDVKSELDAMLADDGYWGVEKTSQRMFDFAYAYTGDNVEELEKAKEAVLKGFEQAEAMFGGQLPQISYDTKEAAMQKFDERIANINNSLTSTYA